MSDLPVGETG